MKPIKFTKMHGLGNDFVVINTIKEPVDYHAFSISQLANRHLGIGFDQLLFIEPSNKADFFCRIFNADGREAEQCGNGLRCVARYLKEEHLHTQDNLTLETKAGVFSVGIKDYDHISVNFTQPVIKEKSIEFIPTSHPDILPLSILSLGNPHAIAKVATLNNLPINQLAQEIAAQKYFPQGVNVGFMEVINKNHIRLRTIERGIGETYACGSNACTAAVAGILNEWLENPVRVEFSKGSLMIDWAGENQPIIMTGPATRVFAGSCDLNHFSLPAIVAR